TAHHGINQVEDSASRLNHDLHLVFSGHPHGPGVASHYLDTELFRTGRRLRSHLLAALGQYGYPRGEGTQKSRMPNGIVCLAIHGDVVPIDLVTIADCTEPDDTRRNSLTHIRYIRQGIVNTRGDDHPPRQQLTVAIRRQKPITMAVQAVHLALLQACTVAHGLLAQTGQQIGAGDTRRKAGVVMTLRNVRSTAGAGIQHQAAPAKSREIDGSSEACGPAADNQAIEGRQIWHEWLPG